MNESNRTIRRLLAGRLELFGGFAARRVGLDYQVFERAGAAADGRWLFRPSPPPGTNSHPRAGEDFTADVDQAALFAIVRVSAEAWIREVTFGSVSMVWSAPERQAIGQLLAKLEGLTVNGRRIGGVEMDQLLEVLRWIERDAMAQLNGLPSSPLPSLGTLELDTSHEGDVVNFSIRNRVDDETTEPFGSGELTSDGKLSMLFADGGTCLSVESRGEIGDLSRLERFFVNGHRLNPIDCRQLARVLERIYDAAQDGGREASP